MNTYRVDRSKETVSPPCGMSSVRYLGDNLEEALEVFHHTKGGMDAWDVPNENYGVMLSIWDQGREEYVRKVWKSK
jgi:hypothetical protein